jgi:long-subunit fatty acid transport protein
MSFFLSFYFQNIQICGNSKYRKISESHFWGPGYSLGFPFVVREKSHTKTCFQVQVKSDCSNVNTETPQVPSLIGLLFFLSC